MRLLSSLADRLSNGYRADPRFLGVIRILFAIHVLLFPVGYTWVSAVPGDFFQPPPGVFSLLDSAPPMTVMVGLEVARAILAVLLLVGYRTFAVSIAIAAVMIVGSGITYSFGKVDHTILYDLLPAFMAFAGWGAAYSLDAKFGRAKISSGLPLLLWAITVAFALLTAAQPKAANGWLDPTTEATRGFLAIDLANSINNGPMGEWFFRIDNPWFWKSLDYATVFFEGWLILAVFVPFLFRCGLAMMLMLHLGVFLMLGINFSGYVFVYAVFFSPIVVPLIERIGMKVTASRRGLAIGSLPAQS